MPEPMTSDRSQFLGRLASTTQLIFAILIAGVASVHFEAGFVPRGLVLLVAFSLPGVVGYLGTMARRPALLVAAGVTSAIGAFIAFSGVTLIFLIPALLFLAGAVRLGLAPAGSGRGGLLANVVQVGIAAAIVVLVLGAGASGLLITDEGCWSEFPGPAGVRVEPYPYSTGEISVPDGATSTSCSTGIISARGAGLGALLAILAVGLALVAARRPIRKL
jgi:hypothetical protein